MLKATFTLRLTGFFAALLVALIAVGLSPLPAKAVGTYTVTYSSAGSTSGTPPETSEYVGGDTVTAASGTSLQKTGFTFNGWSTSQNSRGTYYSPGQTFEMPESAVTLYPVWRGTINYYANGGLGASSVTSQNFNLGSNISLATVGTLNRFNYSFLGWSTSVKASAYTVGGGSFSTSGLTASPVSLYAVWGRTLNFSINGATIGSAPSSKPWIDGGAGIDLSEFGNDLKRRGYDFAGWSTSANGVAIKGPFFPTSALQTVYAAWTPQPTKKTFFVNFASKKKKLSTSEQTELSEFATIFDQAALFPKSKVKIFIGSVRYRTAPAKLGKDRISVIRKFLKAKGIIAEFLWSNNTRNLGKISDVKNNRVKVISTWVN